MDRITFESGTDDFVLLSSSPPAVSHTSSSQLISALQAVQRVLTEFTNKTQEIKKSGHFTSEGIQTRLGEIARYSLNDLAPYDTIVSRVEAENRDLIEQAQKQRPALDAMTAIKHVEIRNYLLSLSDQARIEVIDEAFNQQDRLVMDAVLDAPRIIDLIPFPTYISKLKAAHDASALSLDTSYAERVRNVRRLKEALTLVRKMIAQEAGLDMALQTLWYKDESEESETHEQSAVTVDPDSLFRKQEEDENSLYFDIQESGESQGGGGGPPNKDLPVEP